MGSWGSCDTGLSPNQTALRNKCFWNFGSNPKLHDCSTCSQVSLAANFQKRISDLLGFQVLSKRIQYQNYPKIRSLTTQVKSSHRHVSNREGFGSRFGILQKRVFLRISDPTKNHSSCQVSYESSDTVPSSGDAVLAILRSKNPGAEVREPTFSALDFESRGCGFESRRSCFKRN